MKISQVQQHPDYDPLPNCRSYITGSTGDGLCLKHSNIVFYSWRYKRCVKYDEEVRYAPLGGDDADVWVTLNNMM